MFGSIQNITAQNAVRESEISAANPLSDHNKRNQNQSPPQNPPQLAEETTTAQEHDITILSTLSVIRFLENILEERLGIQETPQKQTWFSQDSANQNHAKQAVYAYAHAAEISKAKLTRLTKSRQHARTQTRDSEDIYALIRRLRDAYSSEILTLHVKQDLPFYDSIKLALSTLGR